MDILFTHAGGLADNWIVRLGLILFSAVVLFSIWSVLYRALIWMARKTNSKTMDILLVASYMPVLLVFLLLTLYTCLEVLTEQIWIDVPPTKALRPYLIAIALFWWLLRFISQLEKALFAKEPGLLPAVLMRRIKLDAAILHSAMFIIRAGVVIAFLLSLLNMSGISLAGILAFGGIGGIIIGFAIKDTLANFFAGLLIFWERPFMVGEWVRCPSADIEGTVEQIGWRITRIRTFNRRPIYVPNSVLVANHIETPQRMTHRRIEERIGLRYSDIDRLPKILAAVRTMLKSHPGIDTKERSLVVFESYGDYALIILIIAMTSSVDWYDYNKTKEDVLFNIATIVTKHKADFAFPTQTLHLAQQKALPKARK